MPTGYTCDIEKGISFKEYALNCARAFGANVLMRDEPKSAPIKTYESDPYYVNKLVETIKEKEQFLTLSEEHTRKMWNKEYQQYVTDRTDWNKDKEILREKYEAMLEQVRLFEPPTEEHVNYKKFMESQIVESIQWDCSLHEIEEQETFEDWLVTKLEGFNEDIEYYTKKNEEEISSNTGRNEWNEKLFEALDKIQ